MANASKKPAASAPTFPAPAATSTTPSPESLSAPNASAPATPSQGANPAATATNTGTASSGKTEAPAPGTTGTPSGEQLSAERAVLGQAPASGDLTAQERPKEVEGTRPSGPAATSSSDEATTEENDFGKALESMGERSLEDIAGELIEKHGSLVRRTSGTWAPPNAPGTTSSTGNTVAAPFVTDKVVARMIASGKYRAASTLRGRPRSVVAVNTEEPAEPAEG